MIGGVVNARCEAVVTLRLRGRGGAELAVAAVVDSGFTSAVALPVAAVLALGLVRQSTSYELKSYPEARWRSPRCPDVRRPCRTAAMARDGRRSTVLTTFPALAISLAWLP